MTQPNLLELAKHGDPQAIADLMNRSLQPKGMTAHVTRQGDSLEIVLEADRIPNRQALTTFVEKGIHNLEIESLRSVQILGQQTGADVPAWSHQLHFGTPIGVPAESAVATAPGLPNEPPIAAAEPSPVTEPPDPPVTAAEPTQPLPETAPILDEPAASEIRPEILPLSADAELSETLDPQGGDSILADSELAETPDRQPTESLSPPEELLGETLIAPDDLSDASPLLPDLLTSTEAVPPPDTQPQQLESLWAEQAHEQAHDFLDEFSLDPEERSIEEFQELFADSSTAQLPPDEQFQELFDDTPTADRADEAELDFFAESAAAQPAAERSEDLDDASSSATSAEAFPLEAAHPPSASPIAFEADSEEPAPDSLVEPRGVEPSWESDPTGKAEPEFQPLQADFQESFTEPMATEEPSDTDPLAASAESDFSPELALELESRPEERLETSLQDNDAASAPERMPTSDRLLAEELAEEDELLDEPDEILFDFLEESPAPASAEDWLTESLEEPPDSLDIPDQAQESTAEPPHDLFTDPLVLDELPSDNFQDLLVELSPDSPTALPAEAAEQDSTAQGAAEDSPAEIFTEAPPSSAEDFEQGPETPQSQMPQEQSSAGQATSPPDLPNLIDEVVQDLLQEQSRFLDLSLPGLEDQSADRQDLPPFEVLPPSAESPPEEPADAFFAASASPAEPNLPAAAAPSPDLSGDRSSQPSSQSPDELVVVPEEASEAPLPEQASELPEAESPEAAAASDSAASGERQDPLLQSEIPTQPPAEPLPDFLEEPPEATPPTAAADRSDASDPDAAALTRDRPADRSEAELPIASPEDVQTDETSDQTVEPFTASPPVSSSDLSLDSDFSEAPPGEPFPEFALPARSPETGASFDRPLTLDEPDADLLANDQPSEELEEPAHDLTAEQLRSLWLAPEDTAADPAFPQPSEAPKSSTPAAEDPLAEDLYAESSNGSDPLREPIDSPAVDPSKEFDLEETVAFPDRIPPSDESALVAPQNQLAAPENGGPPNGTDPDPLEEDTVFVPAGFFDTEEPAARPTDESEPANGLYPFNQEQEPIDYPAPESSVQPPSWLVLVVLFAVSGWVVGLIGFSLGSELLSPPSSNSAPAPLPNPSAPEGPASPTSQAPGAWSSGDLASL